jgi:hypothetical protein
VTKMRRFPVNELDRLVDSAVSCIVYTCLNTARLTSAGYRQDFLDINTVRYKHTDSSSGPNAECVRV